MPELEDQNPPADDTTGGAPAGGQPDDTQDTFPRSYVEELRTEAAGHRTAAKEAKDALLPLQQRLFAVLVESTGKLADPTDLPFDVELLEDGKLEAAITDLLAKKPHLAKRKVQGDIGQGEGTPGAGVNLAGMLAARA